MTLVHIAGKFPAIILESHRRYSGGFCINNRCDHWPIWQSEIKLYYWCDRLLKQGYLQSRMRESSEIWTDLKQGHNKFE